MKKFFAEFIGTFVLVLFACGTATVLGCATDSPDVAYALTAVAFGLVIVAMAYSIGNVSGCHINPAVSLGVLLTGGMTVGEFFIYIIAQFLGATAGAAVLGALVGFDTSLGTNGLFNDSILKSLVIECILTFVFVLVILSVCSKKKYEKFAGLVIGFTLTLVHIFGIYFTGTSVNPARSFGPALIKAFTGDASALTVYWVFLVAPLVGGALAALVFKGLIKSKEAE
ncbi:MAG: aquaporin [Ruminococcus sp.]|uniref:MIP/aquaporin family protein n=1 Tax=Ruminococcus sp. TaxID=41978 RepID=UPI002873345F|nr:aquaporin [Ruminococcus sp.]MBQ3284277.1 aquaporin [Ruminococcus sp.]